MQIWNPNREATRIATALLLVRIAIGMVFLYHGSAILWGAFGGPGPAGFAAHMNMPPVTGILVGMAQFFGGLAVLTGVLARLGGACIAIVMLGAIVLVHLPHGFDIQKGGVEYALTQLLLAVAIVVAGAGPYSLGILIPRGSAPVGRRSIDPDGTGPQKS